MRQLKRKFMNLRIKHKLFFLLSLILISFSIGGLLILQYVLHVYNDEIYRQSANSINVSSALIEKEIKNIDKLSYQLATDYYLQSYLSELNSSENEYEAYLIGVSIKERLIDLGAFNEYIDSVQLYDLNDQGYAAGNRVVTIGEDKLLFYKQAAIKENGGAEWFFPAEGGESFAAAREVNSYLDHSFSRLGMVVVRFNMDEIVSAFENSLEEQEGLLILNGNNEPIFPQQITQKQSFLSASAEGDKGYRLVNYKGERYFVTYAPAAFTKWTYMIASPYSQLFDAALFVRNIVLIIYLIIFAGLLILGIRFINGITTPIEALNKKMKKVQTGKISDFKEDENNLRFSQDETGQMHDNFNKMMNQIQLLIDENYKKQLVIKDSEYKTLQAQINPHFLYNTLESINWSAKLGKHQEISHMATSLGFILRSSLETKQSIITLGEELEIVHHYITIQSYRFEERLRFQTDIPAELLICRVPRFSLQPLVENAIRYGLQEIVGTCTIKLAAERMGETVMISVMDDGPGMDQTYTAKLISGDYRPKGTGLGIKNINKRLKLLFGTAYGIHVTSEAGRGTKIMLTIPYEGGEDHVQRSVSR